MLVETWVEFNHVCPTLRNKAQKVNLQKIEKVKEIVHDMFFVVVNPMYLKADEKVIAEFLQLRGKKGISNFAKKSSLV